MGRFTSSLSRHEHHRVAEAATALCPGVHARHQLPLREERRGVLLQPAELPPALLRQVGLPLALEGSADKLAELGNSLSCLVFMLDAIFCTKGEYREIVLSIFQRMGESLAYLYLTVSYLLVLSNGNEPELACWRVITPSEIPAAVQYGNAVPSQSTRLYNIFGFMNVA